MNTVGKILVILNFLFAVIVGAFLVADVATRNQWKEKYFELLKEANMSTKSRDVTVAVTGNVVRDYKDLQIELEQSHQKLKDQEVAAKAMKVTLQVDIADRDNKLKDADLSLKQALAAKQRLTDEIAVLNSAIKDRESTIVQLQASVKVFRQQAQNFESIARTRQIQNENLLEQLRDVTRALALKDSGVSPERMVVRNPNDPNPPAFKIDGKIEKVEGTLVQLTLGTDHGLQENNTLDVYRLQPNPQYLGMVRIVDARHHTSVGRLIPSGSGASKLQPREGDLVTSKFK
jgi:hypothetical protein